MTKKDQTAGQAEMASYNAVSTEAGELALAKSPVFCTYGLRLYCGLNVNDGEIVDYLVCTPKAALLGIRLGNSRDITPAAQEGDIPITKIPRLHMKNGTVSYLESEIYHILAQDAAQPTLSVCRIPRELHPKLADMRMIQHPDGSQLWEPTSYGASLGILRGYLGGVEAEQALFTLNAGVLDRLRMTLDWEPYPADRWDIVPWEQRLEKLSQGRPCNSAYAASLVRTLADMPLSELRNGYLNELEKLEAKLNGPLNTFQDAAFQIGKLMHGSKQEKTQAGTLAVDLIKPLIHNTIERRRRAFFLTPDIDVPFKPGTSWNDRITRLDEKGDPFHSVRYEPFPTILEGAAVVSGQPYLMWLIQEILNEEEILNGKSELLQNSFQKMLRGAKTQMDSTTPETAMLGRNLLLKLAIEPFYLMRLSENQADSSE